MKNCLVTEFYGNVNNDNIPGYNTIRVKMNVASDNRYGEIPRNTENPFTLTVLEDGYLFEIYDQAHTQTRTVSSDSYKAVKFPVGSYTIEISNKYNVTMDGKNGSNVDMLASFPLGNQEDNPTLVTTFLTSDLYYAQNFKGVATSNLLQKMYNFEGNLADLKYCSNLEFLCITLNLLKGSSEDVAALTGLKMLLVRDTDFVLNAEAIGELTNLEEIRLSTRVPNVVGDISDFSSLKKLKRVIIYGTGLTGNFDQMLTAWSTAGKTDTCIFTCVNQGIQFFTSNSLSNELNNGTTFTIQFNGDGTWQKV